MIPITKSSRKCKLTYNAKKKKKMIKGSLGMGSWHRETGERY